jgi:hypothetical protein
VGSRCADPCAGGPSGREGPMQFCVGRPQREAGCNNNARALALFLKSVAGGFGDKFEPEEDPLRPSSRATQLGGCHNCVTPTEPLGSAEPWGALCVHRAILLVMDRAVG